MKNLLIVLLIFCASNLFAQSAVATQEQIDAFYKTKTCVVYDADMFNSYNSKIKEAVDQNWKATQFEYITMSEYEQRKNSTKYSFLIRVKVVFDKDDEKTPYSFITLILGGKNSINKAPTLCDFPLSYYNVDYDKYDYKLGAIVLFMQNHVKLTKEHPELNEKNILKYYNKNVNSIKGKTLYAIKDELESEVNTNAKIKKVYSGEVKIVKDDDILKIIKDQDANAVFLHKVGPPKDVVNKERVYKIILGAADGNLYYFDYHKLKKGKKPDAFLKEDFEKMAKEK